MLYYATVSCSKYYWIDFQTCICATLLKVHSEETQPTESSQEEVLPIFHGQSSLAGQTITKRTT